MTGAGAIPNSELEQLGLESSDEDESDTDTQAGDDPFIAGNASRTSLPAPEADETPDRMPASSLSSSSGDKGRKRFSLGWGRYMPKLGIPKPSLSRQASSRSQPMEGDDDQPHVPTTETVEPAKADEEDAAVVEPPPANSNPESHTASFQAPAPEMPFAASPPERRELEAKIISQIIREFSSGGFFYSLDFDLTHSLQHKRRILEARTSSGSALANLLGKQEKKDASPVFPESVQDTIPPPRISHESEHEKEDDFVEPDIHVPLWRRLDKRFFWNESLMKDFIELGLHSYIVPVMQGWVQSSSFSIPVPPNPLNPTVSLGDVPVDLVVISRRSRDRAGLRYQRRGIDDEGHVANMVETEMIVRAKVSHSGLREAKEFRPLTDRSRARSHCSASFKFGARFRSSGHNRPCR